MSKGKDNKEVFYLKLGIVLLTIILIIFGIIYYDNTKMLILPGADPYPSVPAKYII